jgi:Regulator of chromosome condensation (RCC1) repeat
VIPRRGAGPIVVVSVAVGLAAASVGGMLAAVAGVRGHPIAQVTRELAIALVMTLVCLRLLSSKGEGGPRVPSFDARLGRCIVFGVVGGVLAGAVALAGVRGIAVGALVGLLCGLALRPFTKFAFGRFARRSSDAFGGALMVSCCLVGVAGHVGGAAFPGAGIYAAASAITVALSAIGFAIVAVLDLRRASFILNVADGRVGGWAIVANEQRVTLGTFIDGVDGDAVLVRAPPVHAGSPFRSADRPSPVALVDRTAEHSAMRARIRAVAALVWVLLVVVLVPGSIHLVRFLVAQSVPWPRSRALPAQVAGLDGDFTKMSMGESVGCAQRPDGILWCWGSWPAAELGVSSTAKPRKELGVVTAFAVGDQRICAVPQAGERRAICWGHNAFGQLGDGTTSPYRGPRAVGPPDVVELAHGQYFTIARTKDGQVWEWGVDPRGDLYAQVATREPQVVAGISDVVEIAASRDHACALDRAGAVFCWGHGGYGQTGLKRAADGRTGPYTNEPIRVEGLPPIHHLTLGGDASAAYRKGDDGKHEWWTWGHRRPWGSQRGMPQHPDGYGEVAVIPSTEEMVTVQIAWASACGLFEGGAVRCWGDGQQGRLGDGRTEPGEHPLSTPLPAGVLEITGNEEGTCARRAGNVLCWGFQ